jgi:hypothetical protein
MTIKQCLAVWHRLHQKFNKPPEKQLIRQRPDPILTRSQTELEEEDLYLAVSRRLVAAAQIERITIQETMPNAK